MNHYTRLFCTAILLLNMFSFLCGCVSQEPTQEENPVTEVTVSQPAEAEETWKGLTELREHLEQKQAIAGIFCLGSYDGKALDSHFESVLEPFQEDFPFLGEIEYCAITDGSNIFCIIPTDPLSKIEVTEWDESVKPVAGEVIYESENGVPFFVQGNVSDIMPNLSVTITDSQGRVLREYHPFISMQDGRVSVRTGENQPVLVDLTPEYFFDISRPENS